MAYNSELVDLELRIIYETEKAFLLTDVDADERTKTGAWLAKSQMEVYNIVDGSKKGVRLISFTIPRWLAEQENLI